jgi:hypothetical protein
LEAREPRQASEAGVREAPIHEIVACVDLARLRYPDRGAVAIVGVDAVGLEQRALFARAARGAARADSRRGAKMPMLWTKSKCSSSRSSSNASSWRYSTDEPSRRWTARKPSAPSSSIPQRALTQSRYCSLSTATTRPAPRRSANTPAASQTSRRPADFQRRSVLDVARFDGFHAFLADALLAEAIAAYDRVIELRLERGRPRWQPAQAPIGGEGTGPNPSGRAKSGWKWSVLMTAGPSCWCRKLGSACDLVLRGALSAGRLVGWV